MYMKLNKSMFIGDRCFMCSKYPGCSIFQDKLLYLFNREYNTDYKSYKDVTFVKQVLWYKAKKTLSKKYICEMFEKED